MNNNLKKTVIFGAGDFGTEVLKCIIDEKVYNSKDSRSYIDSVLFMDDNKELQGTPLMGCPVISRKDFDINKHELVVAISNPQIRKKIVDEMPPLTNYASIIHPSVWVNWGFIQIGKGSIVTQGVALTCNTIIGDHCHLNLNTTIGHDCIIGNYFTTAPDVNISGKNVIGNNVYMGTGSMTKQGISIASNTTVGIGGVVLKDIDESGVYVNKSLSTLEKIK